MYAYARDYTWRNKLMQLQQFSEEKQLEIHVLVSVGKKNHFKVISQNTNELFLIYNNIDTIFYCDLVHLV